MIALLGGGGIVKRWTVVGGSWVTEGVIFKGNVRLQSLPSSLCFLAVMMLISLLCHMSYVLLHHRPKDSCLWTNL